MFSGFRFLLRSLALVFALAAPIAAQTVTIGNGSAAAPTLRPIGSPATGLYRYGADTLGFAAFGFNGWRMTTASSGLHAYLIGPATNSGTTLFSSGTGNSRQMQFRVTDASGNQDNVLNFSSTGTDPYITIQGAGNGAAVPQLNFTQTNLGIYRVGADTLGIAAAGRRVVMVGGADSSTTFLGRVQVPAEGGSSNLMLRFGTGNTGIWSNSGDLRFVNSGSTNFRVGSTVFTDAAAHRFQNGSAGTPSISFSSASTSGMWWNSGLSTLSWSVGGTEYARIWGSGVGGNNGVLQSIGQVFTGLGTAANPAYTSNNDQNTGIYFVSNADTLGFSVGGTGRWMMTTGGLMPVSSGGATLGNNFRRITSVTSQTYSSENGAVNSPSYNWINSVSTGFYYAGNNINADTVSTTILGRRALAVRDSQVMTVPGRTGRPSYSFIGDDDTGMYGGAELGFTHNGTTALRIQSTFVSTNGIQFQPGSGTAAAPGVAFVGSNEGIYRSGDTVGVSVNGAASLKIADMAATGAGDVALCWTTGAVVTQGATCGSSTSKIKTGISALTGDLALALRPRSYTYREGFYNERSEFGLIAEEAAAVDPRFAFFAESDQVLRGPCPSTATAIERAQVGGCVIGTIKKGDPINVNDRSVQSAMLALLIKQQAQIDALTAKVDSLSRRRP